MHRAHADRLLRSQILLFVHVIEFYSNNNKWTLNTMFIDPKREPGNLGFDPMRFGEKKGDRAKMEMAELKNGRLAMLAFSGEWRPWAWPASPAELLCPDLGFQLYGIVQAWSSRPLSLASRSLRLSRRSSPRHLLTWAACCTAVRAFSARLSMLILDHPWRLWRPPG
jgi:hypothetical protein